MKYAFIALIAIYLVVYGCSPDSSEKATDSHETTATATMEKPHQAEVPAVAADTQEPAAAPHVEHQKAADVVKDAVVEEPVVEAEVVEEVTVVEKPVAEAEVVEEVTVVEKPVAEAEVVEEVTVVEEPVAEAEVVEEVIVIEEVVETAEKAQPVVEEQQAAEVAETQLVVMPCGRTMARADIPKNAPCLKPAPPAADTAYSKQDLNAVMQRMVETTNEMVLATKQLVIATQEVLNAGKEIIEAQEVTQPAEQAVEGQAPAATQQ